MKTQTDLKLQQAIAKKEDKINKKGNTNDTDPEEKYYANHTSWLERDSDDGSDY